MAVKSRILAIPHDILVNCSFVNPLGNRDKQESSPESPAEFCLKILVFLFDLPRY